MGKIEELIESKSDTIKKTHKYINWEKLEDQLKNNAISTFNINKTDNIYGIFDTTMFDNCKGGYIFCSNGFYHKGLWAKPVFYEYQKISHIANSGKGLSIEFTNGMVDSIIEYDLDYEAFSNLVNEILTLNKGEQKNEIAVTVLNKKTDKLFSDLLQDENKLAELLPIQTISGQIAISTIGSIILEYYPEYILWDNRKFRYSELESKINFRYGGSQAALYFEEEKISEKDIDSSLAKKYEEKLNQIKSYFYDDVYSSPKYELDEFLKKSGYSVNGKEHLNIIYKIYFKNPSILEKLIDNNVFSDNSISVIDILVNKSAGFDLAGTAKKNLSVSSLLKDGPTGIFDKIWTTTKSVAMASADRVFSKSDTDIFLILTQKNVVYISNDSVNIYQLEDALNELDSRDDEILAGVVDIYDRITDTLLIDNVSKNNWQKFYADIKLIKQQLVDGTDEPSNSENNESLEDKLLKLKSMKEKGLIDEDEYKEMKSKLLENF